MTTHELLTEVINKLTDHRDRELRGTYKFIEPVAGDECSGLWRDEFGNEKICGLPRKLRPICSSPGCQIKATSRCWKCSYHSFADVEPATTSQSCSALKTLSTMTV